MSKINWEKNGDFYWLAFKDGMEEGFYAGFIAGKSKSSDAPDSDDEAWEMYLQFRKELAENPEMGLAGLEKCLTK